MEGTGNAAFPVPLIYAIMEKTEKRWSKKMFDIEEEVEKASGKTGGISDA